MVKRPKSRPFYLLRMVRARPRLFSCALLCAPIAIFTPAEWHTTTRFLVAWNVAVWVCLVLIYILVAQSETRQIAERAASQDEGSIAILILTGLATLATIFAIIFELSGARNGDKNYAHMLFAVLTILTSWFFIHTIFALHYAHEYYGERGDKKSGLKFPDDKEPNYWDFVYFSFVIGMTAQVSDVAVTSKALRKTVLAHAIVSFLYNVSILALTINIAANVI